MNYKDPDKKREYQRRWVAQRRAEWFKDKSCADCGSVEDLQLDHVDATLKISHNIWSWSAKKREDELVKCVARCRPCHKKKTVREREHAFGAALATKLSAEVVQEIRQKYAAGGASTRALAKEYNVNKSYIWKIVSYEKWRRV